VSSGWSNITDRAGRVRLEPRKEAGVPVAHFVQVQGAGVEHYEAAVRRLHGGSALGGGAFHEVGTDDQGLRIVDVRQSEREFQGLLEQIVRVAAEAGFPPPQVSSYEIKHAAGEAGGSGLEYYEQEELWDESSGYENPVEQVRAERLAGLVRDLGPRRVLDAGAGNGIVANRLDAMGIDVMALDHSPLAMARVSTPKVVADIGNLPFEDAAFDLVLSSEVLEHLPPDVFTTARSELGRVARRWVLVTVPNREDLFASGVVCPACRARSSPWRHMRSFAPADLTDLIPGFRATAVEAFGPVVQYQRRVEAIVMRELLDRRPWPPNAICPQCGYRLSAVQSQPVRVPRASAARSLKSRVARPLRRRVPKWILATFESRLV
jgi:SAM-dependent methyltransferase